MKKRDKTYLQRFNQLVFVGLITLIMALMLFFVSGMFKWTDHDFALSDFENETMGQAWFAKQNGNHAAEIQLYKQVLEKIPEMEAGLSCKIGKAEYQLGNYLEAITWFNRSLKAERPDSSEVFFHVAMTAQKLKRYSMAEKYYQMVIHHLEYGKEASFNMGNIYFFEYDNQEKALEYYSNAITLPTIKNEYTHMILRELKFRSQKKDSTLNIFLNNELKKARGNDFFDSFDLTEFQKNKPEIIQAIIHNYLGIIYGNKGDKIAAISNFEKAMAIDPEFEDARFNFNKIVSEVNIWK